MDKQTVVALLRKFNRWRKGEIDQWEAGSHTGPHPREISEAIDAACQMLEQEPAAQPAASALSRFNAHMEETDHASPLERLRFFLSLALSPQDWIDVEPFLDALGDRSVAVPDGWLPIETAPKDRTAVLVMRDIWPGTKSGRAEECNGHNTYVAEWWGDEQKGEWTCYMDAIHDPRCPIEPTHWRPLPLPPSAMLAARHSAPADDVVRDAVRIAIVERGPICMTNQEADKLTAVVMEAIRGSAS